MNSFGLYVHVPWCRRRCPYCDFYFEVGKPDGKFVDGIIAEWQARSEPYFLQPAISLYFGGGTPSLLRPSEIERLVQFFRAEGALMPDAEITIEANPEDLTPLFISDLSAGSVNRLSLGIQSFDDAVLKTLGRKHSAEQAKSSLLALKQAGFSNISSDIIMGVAGESHDQLMAGLDFLLEHSIAHISAYLLTIEPNTSFFKRIEKKIMPPVDEDLQADIFCAVQNKLKQAGMIQYDISSYAQNQKFSRHNQIYWGQGSYLGLGPGAHSMLNLPGGGKAREHNQAQLAGWLKNPHSLTSLARETLDNQAALLESLAFGLRNLVVGINPEFIAQHHQADLPPQILPILKKHRDFGWLESADGVYRISESGTLFADAIMRDILCP